MSRSGGSRAPDDQTKLKKQLNELMKLEENKFCADCGCRGPRWASINLGVFICIACSGIHRSLGVHLTFVRSVNLDSWTVEQVQQMQRWGNAKAKSYYEANVPRDYRIPTEHSSVREKEMWIREKYERKRFIGDAPRESEDRGGRRKKHSSDDEEEEEPRRERRKKDRTNSRHGSRTASREATPTQPAVQTPDILSFDVFSAPVQAQAAPSLVDAPAAPKQDEWASFGGSTNAQSGFKDAFAPQPPAPADQHVNKMANIMASFGPSTSQPQQQQQQQNTFPPQQGMAPAPMMNMQMNGMNGMGMMAPRPMGMSMPMSMPMGQQGFMNPMMGQQPNMMMGYPMQNQMFNQQQNGMMMGTLSRSSCRDELVLILS
ncbi:Stromal membrane-associated protein 2 [Phytophthora citrophthora]|uniref:Stromal membrane-associated protein 2 n=1 Tax=Phytophthora citrophthora TaxID=4793 RepID=A0AAD9GK63_9STRA|nr:Stromal membrane-associated protein 2 [Phytophthora citrophthora]